MAIQDLTQKKNNFLTRYAACAARLLDDFGVLNDLRAEWDRLDYGNTIGQNDIDGLHLHLTPVILANGFVTQANLVATLNAGNGTNLEQLRG